MLPVRHPRTWLIFGWLLIAAAVFFSLMPAAQLPKTGIGDKFEHSIAYAVLSLWFAGLYHRSRYLVIGIGLFIMGVGIEVAQGAMHVGRQADYRDVIANTSGIVIGLVLASWWLGGWVQRIDGWTRGREYAKHD